MVTKTEVRNMDLDTALSTLYSASRSHLVGAGCGDGHHVPVGTERHRLEIAMAKVYYKLYKHYPDEYMG